MTYDDWKISAIAERFELNVRERAMTIDAPGSPHDPKVHYLLDRDRFIAVGSYTAKARAEFLVAPILANVMVPWNPDFRLLCGKDMSVAPDLGLSGVCDFVFHVHDSNPVSNRSSCSSPLGMRAWPPASDHVLPGYSEPVCSKKKSRSRNQFCSAWSPAGFCGDSCSSETTKFSSIRPNTISTGSTTFTAFWRRF